MVYANAHSLSTWIYFRFKCTEHVCLRHKMDNRIDAMHIHTQSAALKFCACVWVCVCVYLKRMPKRSSRKTKQQNICQTMTKVYGPLYLLCSHTHQHRERQRPAHVVLSQTHIHTDKERAKERDVRLQPFGFVVTIDRPLMFILKKRMLSEIAVFSLHRCNSHRCLTYLKHLL